MKKILMPQVNVNDDMVTIVRWLVDDGSLVAIDEPICEVETSKATEEVLSPGAGIIRIIRNTGDVAAGELIGRLDLSPDETTPPSIPHKEIPRETVGSISATEPSRLGDTRFTLRALELVEREGISKESFKDFALVRSADVLRLQKTEQGVAMSLPHQGTSQTQRLSPSHRRARMNQAAVTETTNLQDDLVAFKSPINRRKLEEIKVLSAGHLSALPSVVTEIVEITGLENYLLSLSETSTITIASVVTYEVARSLCKFREFNAYFGENGIVFYEDINIGMAMDGSHGLKVAAIKHAETKSISDVAREMEALLDKYTNNSLPLELLTCTTINISDLTAQSTPWFLPLLSARQSAIIGLGSLEIGGKSYLTMTLTFDHRVTEGKRAAEFLRDIRDRITVYAEASHVNSHKLNILLQCAKCFTPVDELPGDKMLIQAVNARGESLLICPTCFEGW